MAVAVVALEEVEPFAGDTIETLRIVSCDWCFQTIVEDIWDKNPCRSFYRLLDGSGLTVCGHCIPRCFEED